MKEIEAGLKESLRQSPKIVGHEFREGSLQACVFPSEYHLVVWWRVDGELHLFSIRVP